MAKAGLLFIGTNDGLVQFSDPGGIGRWFRIGQVLRGEQITALWPAIDNPQIVLAGGPEGAWRSEDGAASWNKILNSPIVAFSGDKSTPQQINAQLADGWLRSTDSGTTWQPTSELTAATSTPIELRGQQPVLLEARSQGIARSDDGGATWHDTTVDTAWSGPVTTIAPARYHIDTALAGTETGQLAITTDRGRTWQMLKQDLPPIRAIAAVRLA